MPTNRLEHFLSLSYPIKLDRDEECGFFATHPDLPGCAAQGTTANEAVANLEDARRLWITTRLQDGLPVREPETGEYSGKLLLRMSRNLHESLAHVARSRDVSLNLLLNEILSQYVGGATLVGEWVKLVRNATAVPLVNFYSGQAVVNMGATQLYVSRVQDEFSVLVKGWNPLAVSQRTLGAVQTEPALQESA